MMRDRFRSPGRGFTISMIPLVLVWIAFYFYAPQHADNQLHHIASWAEMSQSQAREWLLTDARWVVSEYAKLMTIYLAMYWLVSGVAGRGKVARLNAANYLLAAPAGWPCSSTGIFTGQKVSATFCHIRMRDFRSRRSTNAPAARFFWAGLRRSRHFFCSQA